MLFRHPNASPHLLFKVSPFFVVTPKSAEGRGEVIARWILLAQTAEPQQNPARVDPASSFRALAGEHHPIIAGRARFASFPAWIFKGADYFVAAWFHRCSGDRIRIELFDPLLANGRQWAAGKQRHRRRANAGWLSLARDPQRIGAF